jgi:hypothetical protein
LIDRLWESYGDNLERRRIKKTGRELAIAIIALGSPADQVEDTSIW